MADETNNATQTLHQCWSCQAVVAPTDTFCPHCGKRLTHEASAAAEKTLQQPTSPGVNVHARLESIETLLVKTIIGIVIGVGALFLLVGWIVLQLHRFGDTPTNTRSEIENSRTTQQTAVTIAGEQRWHLDAERLCDLEVDQQLELRRVQFNV